MWGKIVLLYLCLTCSAAAAVASHQWQFAYDVNDSAGLITGCAEQQVQAKPIAYDGQPYQDPAIQCFSPAAPMIGAGRADPSRPISPRDLSRAESGIVTGILRHLAGRWNGSIDEFSCLGTDEQPRIELRQYDVDATIEQNIDDVLLIESDIHGIDDRIRRSGLMWLYLHDNRLRFGDVGAINHAAPQWDIEIVTISPDRLVFMRKYRKSGYRGTSVQQIELWSLYLSRGRIKLYTLFYTQGVLSHWRIWRLTK